MASSTENDWKVVVLAENQLDTTIRTSPSTSLEEVMERWMMEFSLSDEYIFTSLNGETNYDNKQTTIEMIGEMVENTNTVILRAKVIEENDKDPDPQDRYLEIIVSRDEHCQSLYVKSSEKLDRILPRSLKRATSYAYNGKPLCLKDTVKQAGLKHKAVIYESTSRISVKLSDGTTKSISMPTEALISHLKAKLADHETEEFSLTYRGRELQLNEKVKDFKHLVEVSKSCFVVLINGKEIKWTIGTGRIKFTDFAFQLSKEGRYDRKDIEALTFSCTGCGRCICKSEEKYQFLQTDCCRVQSLKLIAKKPAASEGLEVTRNSPTRKNYMRKKVRNKPQAKHKITQMSSEETKIDQSVQAVVTEMKLFVNYFPDEFTPNKSHESIERIGKYNWSFTSHLKCQIKIPAPCNGWIEFEELRLALEPIFTSSTQIGKFKQYRSGTNGHEVAQVTSSSDDEVKRSWNLLESCNKDGDIVSSGSAKLKWCDIGIGEKIFVVASRRTILDIYSKS